MSISSGQNLIEFSDRFKADDCNEYLAGIIAQTHFDYSMQYNHL